MDPDCHGLVNGHFRLRRYPGSVDQIRHKIKDQLSIFKKMQSENLPGLLQVQVSDVMPCGLFIQGESEEDGRWMIVGLMPATEAYTEGPMIIVRPSDKRSWEFFEKNWLETWRSPTDSRTPISES